MKKFIVSALAIGSLFAYDLNLTTGWQLLGALDDIDVHSFKDSTVRSVWAYDSNAKQWKAYLPAGDIDLSQYNIAPLNKIKKGEGFWVFSFNNISVDTAKSVLFFDYLVDGVRDFTLDDVANKTFKLKSEKGFVNLSFDSTGKGVLKFPYATYKLEYSNGFIIAKREDNNDTIEFKKLAQNTDGIIVVGVNENYTRHGFFDVWLLNDSLNPVDMNTVLPYKAYDSYGPSYRVFETNGTVELFYYDASKNSYVKSDYDKNFTINNGKIVVNYDKGNWIWNYLYTYITTYDTGYSTIQIVKQIGRYDILSYEENWIRYYTDPNLKGKTWNDAVGADIVIDGKYMLETNGSVSYYNYTDANNTIVKYSNIDNRRTYQINGDTLTVIYHDEHEDWNETFILDSTTGKVTSKDYYQRFEITSSTPIIDESYADVYYYRPLARKKVINSYRDFLNKKITNRKWKVK